MNKLGRIQKAYEKYIHSDGENAAQEFAKEVGLILDVEDGYAERIIKL